MIDKNFPIPVSLPLSFWDKEIFLQMLRVILFWAPSKQLGPDQSIVSLAEGKRGLL